MVNHWLLPFEKVIDLIISLVYMYLHVYTYILTHRQEAYERVKRLLTSKRRELTLLAEKLVEKEELSAEQVREILEGCKSAPTTGA